GLAAPALTFVDASWNTAEVCIVISLYFGLSLAVSAALYATGFYQRLYGREPVEAAMNPQQAPRSPGDVEAAQKTGSRMGLWAEAFSSPLQAIAIPVVLYLICGARPAQLGLTARRLGRNAGLGLLAWAVVTPPLLGLNWLLVYLYQAAGVAGTHEH